MSRWLVRGVQALLVVVLLGYAADWAVLRGRVARGTAFGVVTVHQMLATPLKGQKEEYDYVGDATMPCSRSVFPQAGNSPCWWLARHTTSWQ